jgi:hypothetical protein
VEVSPDFDRERVYLAGYGARGRAARGMHDPLWARAVVVSDGERSAALVAVDSIGLSREDVQDIRASLGWTGGGRFLFIAATHSHSAPDTLGLWGPLPGVGGVDDAYRRRLKGRIAGLVRSLSAQLEPAELLAARAEVDPRGLCSDTRDPRVLDPELDALRILSKGGDSMATLVRWSCHPEVLGPANLLVSADYPGALCERIESETGGGCLFFSGSLGGLLTPDTDRSAPVQGQYKEVERVGRTLADAAMSALDKKGKRIRSGRVDFQSRTVRLRVDNSRFLLFLPSLAFGHALSDSQGLPLPGWKVWMLAFRHLAFFPLPEGLRPEVETEVSLVRLGPVSFLGIPGELFPELAIGGYGGERSFGKPSVSPGNPNPPDLSQAPKPPYLRERMKTPFGWIVGLAGDEIGYIVPRYDFQAAPTRSMLPRPAGTHYEETNSIGPEAASALLEAAGELLNPRGI